MLLWLTVVLVLVWTWVSTRRPSWCPSGPVLLPVIGNLLSVDQKRPHITLKQWAKRFGGIFYCKFGVQEVIVLSDADLIREAFSKAEITARPDTELFNFVSEGKGIASSNGELWSETRRLTLHNLRNLGMGKSKLETFIHAQISDFLDGILSQNCGKAIELGTSLNVAIVNIIWRMIASEELGLNDPWATHIMDMMTEALEYSEKLAVLDFFPWLKHVLPERVLDRKKMDERIREDEIATFLPVVEEHRTRLDLDTEPKDVIDALLKAQTKSPDSVSDWHILMAIDDLFFAGNDTTATTLRWAFCFLCQHPEVQRRLQDEIDAVVGRDRLPALTDRVNMPYSEAVIMETQRMGDIVPLGVAHATSSPVALAGFQIPAGVQIVSNLHSVHYDATFFPEPEQFNPERFIDTNGKFQPSRNVMPFSAGRRKCLGESLARAELFLFLTGFVQSFSFRWPEGFKHDFSEDLQLAAVRKPSAYKLIAETR